MLETAEEGLLLGAAQRAGAARKANAEAAAVAQDGRAPPSDTREFPSTQVRRSKSSLSGGVPATRRCMERGAPSSHSPPGCDWEARSPRQGRAVGTARRRPIASQRVHQLHDDGRRDYAGQSFDREVTVDPQLDNSIRRDEARAARDELLVR